MKVNKWTITAAQLNTDNPVVVDVETIVTREPESQQPSYDNKYYPNDILVKNTSGVPVGYTIIGNAAEYAEWQAEQADPGSFPYFDWIPIETNETVTGKIPRAIKIIFKKTVDIDVAGADIELYGKLVKSN